MNEDRRAEGLSCHLDLGFADRDGYAAIAPSLKDVVTAMSFFSSFTRIDRNEDRPGRITAASLRGAIEAPGGRGFTLSNDDNDLRLSCWRNGPDYASLTLRVLGPFWNTIGPDLGEVVETVLEALHDPVVLPASGILAYFDPDLPWVKLPRPPIAPYLRYGSVVDFFDARAAARWEAPESTVITHLAKASPPPPAVIRAIRQVTSRWWTTDLCDPAALIAARAAHQTWMAAEVAPILASMSG